MTFNNQWYAFNKVIRPSTLRRIVNAHSVKEYQQAVSDLKESEEWKADTSEKNFQFRDIYSGFEYSNSVKQNQCKKIWKDVNGKKKGSCCFEE